MREERVNEIRRNYDVGKYVGFCVFIYNFIFWTWMKVFQWRRKNMGMVMTECSYVFLVLRSDNGTKRSQVASPGYTPWFIVGAPDGIFEWHHFLEMQSKLFWYIGMQNRWEIHRNAAYNQNKKGNQSSNFREEFFLGVTRVSKFKFKCKY